MPKQIIEDTVWEERISESNKYYTEWENLFMCNILEKYYEGHQYKDQRALVDKPYVINKVFETIEIKLAQFIPTLPRFQVVPKAQSMQFDIEEAINSATLKQDVLNTLIANDEHEFASEVEDAYRDSYFRFGVLEVGYSADWIINPNAQKPLLQGNTGTNKVYKSKVVQEPEELPANERVYFKHIPAKTFRIGGVDSKYLHRCGWYGYYEYIYKDDLLSIKNLLNKDKVESASNAAYDSENRTISKITEDKIGSGMVKVWHIWDRRADVELLVLDSPKTTIYQRKSKRIRVFDYRPTRNLQAGFYPVPPVFHWISPQDELNEIRNMMRAHRRRFLRKYIALKGKIDDDEIEKFETGGDGTIVRAQSTDALTPVPNAELGQSIVQSETLSSDDLNKISGTSNPQRGIADRATATESNIIQQEGSIRENKERDKVVRWFNRIGREVILTARDKFTLGMLVQIESPEGGQFGQDLQEEMAQWQWVAAEQLDDGYDFKVNVDITSLSTTYQEQEKKSLVEFLTILTQYPMVAFSPILVREIAFRCGYRNMKVIKEFQQMALLSELARMQQLQGAANPQPAMPPNGPVGQNIASQMAPPTAQAIQNQLGKQLQNGMTQ